MGISPSSQSLATRGSMCGSCRSAPPDEQLVRFTARCLSILNLEEIRARTKLQMQERTVADDRVYLTEDKKEMEETRKRHASIVEQRAHYITFSRELPHLAESGGEIVEPAESAIYYICKMRSTLELCSEESMAIERRLRELYGNERITQIRHGMYHNPRSSILKSHGIETCVDPHTLDETEEVEFAPTESHMPL
jgi:hypothetical protein